MDRAEGHLFHFMGLPAESDHRLHQCPHYSALHWIMHHSRWMLWSRLHPHGVTAACVVRHGCRRELQPSFQRLCRGLGLKSVRRWLLSAVRTSVCPSKLAESKTQTERQNKTCSVVAQRHKKDRESFAECLPADAAFPCPVCSKILDRSWLPQGWRDALTLAN